jgi:DNA-binding CsgD family transcriptional regulator
MQAHGTQFIGGFQITDCEFHIIQQLLKLKLRKLIAAVLGKSEDTIDSQMWLLYKKLGIKKVNELLVWALGNGFDTNGNYSPKIPDDIPKVDRKSPPPAKKKKTKKKK